MRGPLVVMALVAAAGIAFVVANEPSPDEARVHDWLAVAFMSATAGLFYAGGTGPRRRFALVCLAYALFVATTLAWFVESALWWIVVAALLAAGWTAVLRMRAAAAPAARAD